jgi:predicted transcriptional regulator
VNLHILHVPMAEVLRRPDGVRWCFVCRKHREFEYVQSNPIVVCGCDLQTREEWVSTGAYYGPSFRIECGTCHTEDGDCFPGTWREWGDG